MACRSCGGGNPPVPYMRNGMPTIWEFGPFAGYEPVPLDEIDEYLPDASADKTGVD